MGRIVLAIYAFVCIVEIGLFAVKFTPKGNRALQTPAGMIWVIQLGCIAFVWLRHESGLRLFWIVPAALFLYFVLGRILHSTGVYRSGL